MEVLMPGDLLGGYVLLSKLAEGGMGEVWLGRTPGGFHVAVKVILRHFEDDTEYRVRFAREIDAARRVSPLYTAKIVKADSRADRPWIAFEYIAAPSLQEVLKVHGPLPVGFVRSLAAAIAEGLEAIHAESLVHRDLKPSNVLLSRDGPKIIDFGVARAVAASSLTRTGVEPGTPAYMSPEQINGLKAGPESDVFSLGSLLVYALTRHLPFAVPEDNPHWFQVLRHRISDEDPDISDVPDDLRPLVARCLEKDPRLRPTPEEIILACGRASSEQDWLPGVVAEALNRYKPTVVARHGLHRESPSTVRQQVRLPELPDPIRPTPAPPPRPSPPSSRKRTVVVLAVLTAAVVATAVAVSLNANSSNDNRSGRHASESGPRTAARYTYTVNPKKWAPQPVPGVTLKQGDVVRIAAVSGQWACASTVGPVGIQGNSAYVATNKLWAAPSGSFCSLIAKIGDGPWQELGQQMQLTAGRAGPLALTANDIIPRNCPQPPDKFSCYSDNQGNITIQIKISSRGASSTSTPSAKSGTTDGVRFLSGGRYAFDRPWAIAIVNNRMYVANKKGYSVSVIDAQTGLPLKQLSGGRYGFNLPDAIAVAASRVWVANAGDPSTVTELNASNGSFVHIVSGYFAGPAGIAVTGNTLWVANYGGDGGASVAEVNALTSVAQLAPSPIYPYSLPDAIAASDGHLWIANKKGSSVIEIKPSTGQVLHYLWQSSYGFNHPDAIAIVGSHVWVANSRTLTELNASNGDLIKVMTGFANPNSITVTGKYIWITDGNGPYGGSVIEINAITSTRARVIAGPKYKFDVPDAIAVAHGHLWIANRKGNYLTVIKF